MFKNKLSPFHISMSSLVTCAAPFDINNDLDENNTLSNNLKRIERSNKTAKNSNRLNNPTSEAEKQNKIAKLREMAISASGMTTLDGEDESKNMGEFSNKFTPPPHPAVLSKTQESKKEEDTQADAPVDVPIDTPINQVTYNTLPYDNPEAYYNQYSQFYNTNGNSPGYKDEDLNRKLDTILYLLEEQQQEKTNFVTEELILYLFLGIFIIFVIDSFVKVGKYVR